MKERDGFRKKRYGFVMTTLGWKNIDRGVSEKDWDRRILRWRVANELDFDRLHIYIATGEPFSLHALEGQGAGEWSTRGIDGRGIPLRKKGKAQLLSVGLKGEQWWYAHSEFELEDSVFFPIALAKIGEAELWEWVNAFDDASARENKVAVDLAYQAELHIGGLKEEKWTAERSFIQFLRQLLEPCCSHYQAFFEENCAGCHAAMDMNSTEPSLVGLRARRSAEWLIAFTLNSVELIGSGDSLAVAVWNANDKANMDPMPHLLPEDVLGILDWVDHANDVGRL